MIRWRKETRRSLLSGSLLDMLLYQRFLLLPHLRTHHRQLPPHGIHLQNLHWERLHLQGFSRAMHKAAHPPFQQHIRPPPQSAALSQFITMAEPTVEEKNSLAGTKMRRRLYL